MHYSIYDIARIITEDPDVLCESDDELITLQRVFKENPSDSRKILAYLHRHNRTPMQIYDEAIKKFNVMFPSYHPIRLSRPSSVHGCVAPLLENNPFFRIQYESSESVDLLARLGGTWMTAGRNPDYPIYYGIEADFKSYSDSTYFVKPITRVLYEVNNSGNEFYSYALEHVRRTAFELFSELSDKIEEL